MFKHRNVKTPCSGRFHTHGESLLLHVIRITYQRAKYTSLKLYLNLVLQYLLGEDLVWSVIALCSNSDSNM